MTAKDVMEKYPELVNLADDRAACGSWPAPVLAGDYLMWIADEKMIQEDNANEDDTFDYGPYIEHLGAFCDALTNLGVTPSTEPWAKRFKVWVLGVGENIYCTNGLDFETVEKAHDYGEELLSRWFGAEDFKVLPLQFDGVDTSIRNISDLSLEVQ